jgi:hypothetical protein
MRNAPKMWRNGNSIPWPRSTSCQRTIEAITPRKRTAAPMAAKVQKVAASMLRRTSSTSCHAGTEPPDSLVMGQTASTHTMRTVSHALSAFRSRARQG